MTSSKSRILFEKSGTYFIGLLLLAFLGFWNSYFSKLFIGHADYSFYFHVHAVLMVVWIILLIVQPLLIHRKKLHLHRLIGKTTYLIMPLLLMSVLLVLNSGMKNIPKDEISLIAFLAPIRDFMLLIVAFSIAIYHRHDIQIHSRAMIITGIVFIEPALFRFLGGMLFKDMGVVGPVIGIALMLAIIITLIIKERKEKSARWLFPSLLAVYIIAYTMLIFEIPLTFLDPAVKWFAALPLT